MSLTTNTSLKIKNINLNSFEQFAENPCHQFVRHIKPL